MLAYVDERAGERTVLAGDLNVGPDEAPERFQLILNAGFSGGLKACTFCDDNPLADGPSATIDHVLARGLDGERTRVLDETPPLSDHDGVQAVLSVE